MPLSWLLPLFYKVWFLFLKESIWKKIRNITTLNTIKPKFGGFWNSHQDPINNGANQWPKSKSQRLILSFVCPLYLYLHTVLPYYSPDRNLSTMLLWLLALHIKHVFQLKHSFISFSLAIFNAKFRHIFNFFIVKNVLYILNS